MTDEVLLQQIRDYIESNRANYTMPALRARLIADGVSELAVDQVIAELSPAPYYGPSPIPPGEEKPWGFGRFFLVCVLSVVVNCVLMAAAFWLAVVVDTGWAFVAVSVVAIAAEVFLAVRYAKQNSAVTAGILVAIFVTPVVVGVLLLGACFVIIASMGGKIAG